MADIYQTSSASGAPRPQSGNTDGLSGATALRLATLYHDQMRTEWWREHTADVEFTACTYPIATLDALQGLAFVVLDDGKVYLSLGGGTDRIEPEPSVRRPHSAEEAAAWARELRRHMSVCLYRDGSVGPPPSDLSWLQLTCVRPVGHTVLVGLLKGVNELISLGKFEQLDTVISSLDVSEATPEALVALARYSAPAQPKLPSWREFVRRVRHDLQGRGADVATLMAGLPA